MVSGFILQGILVLRFFTIGLSRKLLLLCHMGSAEHASGRCQQNIFDDQRSPYSSLFTPLPAWCFSYSLLQLLLFPPFCTEMAPGTPSQTSPVGARTWRNLVIIGFVLIALSALYSFLNSHLDWFYILSPPELHDLSIRAIAAHGNDTRSVVNFITAELQEKLPGGYINLDQEWIFNNAGGAMGAMYIIHASKWSLYSLWIRPP